MQARAAQLLLLVLSLLPALAAAQATAILDLKADPEGALVFLDGELLGEAPLLEIVPAGTHTVRVERDGHAPFEEAFRFVPDAAVEVSVDLVRVAAGLIVHTDAEDAKIFLDGDQIGIGQQVILDPAPAGRHELVVESETLGRWAEAIELKASKLATVDVALRGVMGALAVVTQPAGATVWLDGENVGVTPLDLTAVKPGNHSLRLTLDGHSEVWQALKITEGASARIENTLVAESGSLEVKPVPSGARVYVNGVELGTGRQQLANLKPGMYSVRASAAGYTDAIQPVAVDADKTAKLTVHLESFDGGGRLAGGSPTGKPVTKQPGFWIGIGAGGAAIVGGVITAVAIANANANPAPEPPTGVVAPTATTIIRLP